VGNRQRLDAGCDNRALQRLFGHGEIATTMIWTHVLNRAGYAVVSSRNR